MSSEDFVPAGSPSGWYRHPSLNFEYFWTGNGFGTVEGKHIRRTHNLGDPDFTPAERESAAAWVREHGVDDGTMAVSAKEGLYTQEPFVTTLETIPGYEITELLGLIFATTSTTGMKAKDDDGSIANRLEVRLEHCTRESLEKLWKKGIRLGGDAIVGIKVSTSQAEGSGVNPTKSSGVLAIGTLVRLKKRTDEAPSS